MSHASRSQSFASASNRTFSTAAYESTARIYFLELKLYLNELLVQGKKIITMELEINLLIFN